MSVDPVPSRAARLDPQGEMQMFLRIAKPLSWLLSLSKDGRARGRELRQSAQDAATILRDVDRVGAILSPHGWYVGDHTNPETFAEAARLVEKGEVGTADELLTDWYDEGGGASDGFGWNLRFAVEEARKLYRDPSAEYVDYDAQAIGDGRASLIFEAIENHYDRRFASAIMIAFAQVDGITIDFEPSGQGYMFFSRERNTGAPRATLTDSSTLAGHPEALASASTLMTAKVSTTGITSELRRHGVMHGRDSGSNTRVNSAKALALLRTTIAWATPIAKRRLADAAAAREIEMAGVEGTDSHGRVLDRRGFADAKKRLNDFAIYQRVHRQRTGGFASNALEAVHPRLHKDVVGVQNSTVSPDSYFAWFTTTSGWVLGLGVEGENDWYYSSASAPTSAPSRTSSGWREGLSRKYGHPDWARP